MIPNSGCISNYAVWTFKLYLSLFLNNTIKKYLKKIPNCIMLKWVANIIFVY